MNNDLISREALKKKLQARHDNGEEDFDKGYNIGIETAIELLDNAPTVKTYTLEDLEKAKNNGYKWGRIDGLATTRPQGEWIRKEDVIHLLECWSDGYSYIEIPTDTAIKAIKEFKGGAE